VLRLQSEFKRSKLFTPLLIVILSNNYDVIRDDDLYIVENFDPKEKVFADKKVGDGVKIKIEETLDLIIVT